MANSDTVKPDVNHSYACELRRVVDGDTIDLDIDVGFYMRGMIRIRLLGVDAPEVRGPERPIGQIVTQKVVEWFATGKRFTVQTTKTGKYGRWLGVIWSDNHRVSLNESVQQWTREARDNIGN